MNNNLLNKHTKNLFELLLVLGCYKASMNICVQDFIFISFELMPWNGMYRPNVMQVLSLNFLNCFPKWFCHLTFLLAVQDSSSCSLLTLGTVFLFLLLFILDILIHGIK